MAKNHVDAEVVCRPLDKTKGVGCRADIEENGKTASCNLTLKENKDKSVGMRVECDGNSEVFEKFKKNLDPSKFKLR